jgi:hypothetical protein
MPLKRTETGVNCAASFRIDAAVSAPSGPALCFNPITAADEKIPLSVVHVNNKPQYLVFWWDFLSPTQ